MSSIERDDRPVGFGIEGHVTLQVPPSPHPGRATAFSTVYDIDPSRDQLSTGFTQSTSVYSAAADTCYTAAGVRTVPTPPFDLPRRRLYPSGGGVEAVVGVPGAVRAGQLRTEHRCQRRANCSCKIVIR